MANEVIAAAKSHGIKAQSIKQAQAKVRAVDLTFLDDLFNWNGKFFGWALTVIDLVQASLWALNLLDPENAATTAAFLQKIEDYINSKRTMARSKKRK